MENFKFEENMLELERIVNVLENEKIDLDESIKLYEKAKKIANALEKYLLYANERIARIMQDDKEIPYNENDDKED